MIKIESVQVWAGRKGEVHVQVAGRDERGNRIIGNCTAISPLQVAGAVEEITKKMQETGGHVSIDYRDPVPF